MTAAEIKAQTVLDLCSGCGIVGLDYLFHCHKELGNSPLKADFMEVQDIYFEHFEKNVTAVNSPTPCQFLKVNYAELTSPRFHEKYDLILSNPPYFRVGHGKLSPSEFKNRCRFFIDSDFKALIQGIENALKPGGSAYVLLRDDKDHGYSPMTEARHFLSENCLIAAIEDIRGTAVARIQKRNNKF